MLGFCLEFGDVSVIVFFGVGQSFAKCLSSQLKYLILAWDL